MSNKNNNSNERKDKLKSFLKHFSAGIKDVGSEVKGVFVKPKSAGTIAFEEDLRMKTQVAKRKAFLKQAVKESTAKGKALASKKFGVQKVGSPVPLDVIANVGVPKQSSKPNDKDILDKLMRL